MDRMAVAASIGTMTSQLRHYFLAYKSGHCTEVEEVYGVSSSEVNYQTLVKKRVLAAVFQKSGRN